MSARHKTVAFFVPHEGCPHRCSFCDQNSITGHGACPTPAEVISACEAELPPEGQGKGWEIAFFGGSFTAVRPEIRLPLLEAAAPFVRQGRAEGIRISTRPDAISIPILNELKSYGVTAIELGAQSMSDKILQLNGRGHNSLQVKFAASLVKHSGFSLGLQMMVGLYGETDPVRSAKDTALQLAALSPDTVRIYPTLVLKNTPLARLAACGSYRPLTVAEAAEATAPLLDFFEQKGIRVIRVGLQDDLSLRDSVIAGPYHPAFRQVCESLLYRKNALQLLNGRPAGRYVIYTAPGQASTAIGQKRENIQYLAGLGWQVTVKEKPGIEGRGLILETETGK